MLVSRALSDAVFLNLNLAPPVGTDPHGRVMYGSIRSIGIAIPARRSAFAEVIETRSAAGGHSYELSTRLETMRERLLAGGSRTPSPARATSRRHPREHARHGGLGERTLVSGRHDDLTPSVSSNDIPHRVIVAGSLVAPWSRAPTMLSFYYVGESGRPFTYIAYGTSRRGDLNADGSSTNDPIYVPRDAMDPTEMRFSGYSDPGADNSPAAQAERERAQRTAFEEFVSRTAVSAPPARTHPGAQQLPRAVVEHHERFAAAGDSRRAAVGGDPARRLQRAQPRERRLGTASRRPCPRSSSTSARPRRPGPQAQPIFRFADDGPGWTTVPGESEFQLQVAVRYRF